MGKNLTGRPRIWDLVHDKHDLRPSGYVEGADGYLQLSGRVCCGTNWRLRPKIAVREGLAYATIDWTCKGLERNCGGRGFDGGGSVFGNDAARGTEVDFAAGAGRRTQL